MKFVDEIFDLGVFLIVDFYKGDNDIVIRGAISYQITWETV